MFRSAKHFAGRNVVQFALIGLSGVWLSGCSSDATRLSDSMNHPFGNPFASASNGPAAPTPAVTSQPVSPNTAYIAPVHPSPVASAPLAEPAPASTGTLRAASQATVGGTAEGWTAVGGSPVIVLEGDSAESLGRRYGVPTSALLGANGLKSASQVHQGMRIIVPVYNAHAKTASSAEPIPTAIEQRRATKADAKADDAEDQPRAKRKKLADSSPTRPKRPRASPKSSRTTKRGTRRPRPRRRRAKPRKPTRRR